MTTPDSRPQTSNPSKPKPRRSGVVVPHPPNFIQRLGARLIYLGLRTLVYTIRFDWKNSAHMFAKPSAEPMIFCIWHNRLVLCMEAYRRFHEGRPTHGLAAMCSASKDGGLLAAILERFGVQPIRGSSSRRGSQALLELTTWGRNNYDLAITPDGPRGPRHQVQDGLLALAQLTGMPILPFSFRATWKIRLKSWDRFIIPLPFTRCEMNAGEPIYIPRNLSPDERERLRRQVEDALNKLSGE